ncbi:MAG: hypothetical protein A2Y14_00845 [Verrucomicrobia bacterium GWF2_51_19]|nr:MAG: hypothetical protein A2Y14_00845 [Verrucomicrobia bacterium GWF2_51_19]
MKIRVLADSVVNQIAAGEVVERPVAVVKELLENSLDAGASAVEIEFSNGGKDYIRVEDNGCGMTFHDALLALERHATSKIQAFEDLNSIQTFGFRGEALPSIASVSQFSLKTRSTKESFGTELFVDAGKLVRKAECGMPVGTRIEVSQLFKNVPVRRKFLKSDITEEAHIVECVKTYALAHPQVAFTLIKNGKTLFRSPTCPTLLERVREIWGSVAQDLIAFDYSDNCHLFGLVGKPSISRSTRQEILLFLNRRPIENRTLSFAITEAYHSYIPEHRYPVAFLFVEIDPCEVDVNVHPGKREVRFRNPSEIKECVMKAFGATLEACHPQTAPVVDSTVLLEETPFLAQETLSLASHMTTPVRETPPIALNLPINLNWRYIGPVDDCCELFNGPHGLIIFNAHSAQQRIWYERIQEEFAGETVSSQCLLLPLSLELAPILAPSFNKKLAFFEHCGFHIEPFGGNTFRVDALPSWLDPSRGERFLYDMAEFIYQGNFIDQKPHVAYEVMARHAALQTLQEGYTHSPEAAIRLAEALMHCKNPHTCPRGKPIFFELPQSEINRRLGL